MANMSDLLGALLQRGMTDSSKQRVENSLGENGIGGEGGILEQLGLAPARVPAGAQARTEASTAAGGSDLMGKLGSVARSMLEGDKQGNPLAAGGLGALVGSILGGGTKSMKGAVGGGALALLGSIALQALRGTQQKSQQKEVSPTEQLFAGLRKPENVQEEQEVQSVVDLTVRSMVNAAKADGRIDEDEMQKIVGEMQEDGVTQAERDYLLEEIRKPMETDEIVRAVPNRQVGAQVYAASLLAIEADTTSEKNYLQKLSRDLGLDSQVVSQIHSTLGVA